MLYLYKYVQIVYNSYSVYNEFSYESVLINLINYLDHIDHIILGNIDPDMDFLFNINISMCNYYLELEVNKQFPQDCKFSIFNLNVRSLPKK